MFGTALRIGRIRPPVVQQYEVNTDDRAMQQRLDGFRSPHAVGSEIREYQHGAPEGVADPQ